VDEHRAYLRELKAQGWLLASGPMDPRSGGMLMLRVPDEDSAAALDRIRDELIPWLPVIGKEDLDKL